VNHSNPLPQLSNLWIPTLGCLQILWSASALAECCAISDNLVSEVEYQCLEEGTDQTHVYEGAISDILDSLDLTIGCQGDVTVSRFVEADIRAATSDTNIPHKVTVRVSGGKYSLEAEELLPKSQTLSGTLEMLRARVDRRGQNKKLAESVHQVLDSISNQVDGKTSNLWITLKVIREGNDFSVKASAKSKD
jgi:hypothetical protein